MSAVLSAHSLIAELDRDTIEKCSLDSFQDPHIVSIDTGAGAVPVAYPVPVPVSMGEVQVHSYQADGIIGDNDFLSGDGTILDNAADLLGEDDANYMTEAEFDAWEAALAVFPHRALQSIGSTAGGGLLVFALLKAHDLYILLAVVLVIGMMLMFGNGLAVKRTLEHDSVWSTASCKSRIYVRMCTQHNTGYQRSICKCEFTCGFIATTLSAGVIL